MKRIKHKLGIVLCVLIFTVLITGMSTSAGAKETKTQTLTALCGQSQEYLNLYLETGNVDEKWALLSLKKALEAREVDKTSPAPQNLMAKVYMALGEKDKAYERLRRAIRLSPEDVEAKALLAKYKAMDESEKGGRLPGTDGIQSMKNKNGEYVGGASDGKKMDTEYTAAVMVR